MLLRLSCILALAALVGCGKSSPPPAPSPSATTAAEPAPAPSPPTPAVAPETTPADEAALTELLGQLTQIVRKFAAEQQRVPQSLDELVARGYLSRVPAAPPGKTFTITKQLQVELQRK